MACGPWTWEALVGSTRQSTFGVHHQLSGAGPLYRQGRIPGSTLIPSRFFRLALVTGNPPLLVPVGVGVGDPVAVAVGVLVGVGVDVGVGVGVGVLTGCELVATKVTSST